VTPRLLPSSQWSRLRGTQLGGAIEALPPGSRIVVVEHEGAIVAAWGVLPYTHLEGLWVSPNWRGGRALLTLAQGVRGLLEPEGTQVVLTSCLEGDGAVLRLLERPEAVPRPCTMYSLPVNGLGQCPTTRRRRKSMMGQDEE
jgi:hypothetical protein